MESSHTGRALPLVDGSGSLLFIYTLDAFRLIGRLVQDFGDSPVLERIYVSHGFAAIVFFFHEKQEAEALLENILPSVRAWETWHVENNGIIAEGLSVPTVEADAQVGMLAEKHTAQAKVVFREIRDTLSELMRTAAAYAPEYTPFLKAIASAVESLSVTILFMEQRVSDAEFVAGYSVAVGLKDEAEARDILRCLVRDRESVPDRINALHILGDEAVQFAAVLQNVYVQAFAGLPPLRRACFVPGTYSLLGTGGVFASLVAIYQHVRQAFATARPDVRIANPSFVGLTCPRIAPRDGDVEYEEWRRSLRLYQGIDQAEAEQDLPERSFQMLYFSNRLGFRQTKLTISAAYQCIPLGFSPCWSLCTLTHEYLHTHAKALLTVLLPLEQSEGCANSFPDVFSLYENRVKKPGGPTGQLRFLQVTLMDALCSMYASRHLAQQKGNDSSQPNTLARADAEKAVHRGQHEIEEIIVHILDFHYFYGVSADLYVKAIWSSWLVLPLVISRVEEYALRTVCAIASTEDCPRDDRFARSYSQILSTLQTLDAYHFVDRPLLDNVIAAVRESRISLMKAFYRLCPLIDSVTSFLVSERTGGLLKLESEDALQEDGSYAYPVSPGQYDAIHFKNPTNFMVHGLSDAFGSWSDDYQERCYHYSLWLFHAVGSSLQHEPVGGGEAQWRPRNQIQI